MLATVLNCDFYEQPSLWLIETEWKSEKILFQGSCFKENALFVFEVKQESANWFEMTEDQL